MRRRRRVTAFLWVVVAVFVALYIAGGLVATRTARGRASTAVAAADGIGVPAELGRKPPTRALDRWRAQLTTACQRRNADVYELTLRQQSMRPLGPRAYAERVVAGWTKFARAASSLRAPPGYEAAARWVARVHRAKGRLLHAERDAVFARDPESVTAAHAAYVRLSNRTNPGFIRLGLFWCGQYLARAE